MNAVLERPQSTTPGLIMGSPVPGSPRPVVDMELQRSVAGRVHRFSVLSSIPPPFS